MSKRVGGTFNGTGAALYFCIGFIPDWVRVMTLEGGSMASAFWSRRMRASDCIDGIKDNGGASHVSLTALTIGAGIRPYRGGDLLTADNQTSTAYGEGVYLARDDKDMRAPTAEGGDASSIKVAQWTKGVAAYLGHFDQPVATTKVGEGSKIVIDGKEYVIRAISSNGEAVSEVTLDETVPSGAIEFIGGMYDYAPMAIGKVTSPGFKLNITSLINVNDEINFFEAGTYDDGK